MELRLDLVFVSAADDWAADAVRLLRHADIASAGRSPSVVGRMAERSDWQTS
jgi:hypothetical protein